MSEIRYVSYLRVSTRKQEQSGLGLEAQRRDVAVYVQRTGGELIREFVEVESGKRADRQALHEAISLAHRSKAVLLVAKLDRLSRNVAFLSALMEARVEFVAVDMPSANKLTVHIMAAMAEHEREMISARTKAAMAEAKARGRVFGSARPGHWKGREAARLEGAVQGGARAGKLHRDHANRAYRDVAPLIMELRAAGRSLREIAASLNAERVPTRRGRAWRAQTVSNVISRFGGDAGAGSDYEPSKGLRS